MAGQAPPDSVVTLETHGLEEMSKNEQIKVDSKGLLFIADRKEGIYSFRDELDQMVDGERETISGTAKELSKFFGIYKQQGRGERGKKTKDYFFMVRIKNPAGGRLSTQQWLALDEVSDLYADGSLRITSRQGIQYHRVYGDKLGKMVGT